MRIFIQRVRVASLDVDGRPHAAIGPGFVALVGFGAEEVRPENRKQAEQIWGHTLDKALGLRIFPDESGKMNNDLDSFGGEVLLVSQFTLYADCRRGKRPSFHLSAPAEAAVAAYEHLVRELRQRLGERLKTGVFGADMDIHLTNWGPVSILLDSADFQKQP